MYDDLRRLGIEREVEKRSQADTRMDRSVSPAHMRPRRRPHGGCSRCPISTLATEAAVAGAVASRISISLA
jgi:hypothetical protein